MSEARTIDTLLSQYSESHLNPTNEIIHYICVPLNELVDNLRGRQRAVV